VDGPNARWLVRPSIPLHFATGKNRILLVLLEFGYAITIQRESTMALNYFFSADAPLT